MNLIGALEDLDFDTELKGFAINRVSCEHMNALIYNEERIQ